MKLTLASKIRTTLRVHPAYKSWCDEINEILLNCRLPPEVFQYDEHGSYPEVVRNKGPFRIVFGGLNDSKVCEVHLKITPSQSIVSSYYGRYPWLDYATVVALETKAAPALTRLAKPVGFEVFSLE